MTNTLISVQQYLIFAFQNSWFILKCHHCFHITFWIPFKRFVRLCTFIVMEFEKINFSSDRQKKKKTNLGSKILNPACPKQNAQKLGFEELIYLFQI